jgi:hypothetical protein
VFQENIIIIIIINAEFFFNFFGFFMYKKQGIIIATEIYLFFTCVQNFAPEKRAG